jgi:hypothetical protein
MSFPVARLGATEGDTANFLDQDMEIQVSTNEFVYPHSCYHCDKLKLDFDNPESRKWLHERSSIPLGFSIVECKRAADDGCDLLTWLLKSLVLHPGVIPHIRGDWPLVASVGDSRNQIQFGCANMAAAMCCEREYRAESCWSNKTFTIFRTSHTTNTDLSNAQTGNYVTASPSNLPKEFVDDELIITTMRTQQRLTFP